MGHKLSPRILTLENVCEQYNVKLQNVYILVQSSSVFLTETMQENSVQYLLKNCDLNLFWSIPFNFGDIKIIIALKLFRWLIIRPNSKDTHFMYKGKEAVLCKATKASMGHTPITVGHVLS